MVRRIPALVILAALSCASPPARPVAPLPVFLEARRDLWGEEAIRRPEGPTYEFFAGLLPPPRYVNAAFRHYPIVLSAPGAARKARLVSNGSAVNARGGHVSWHDVGVPVSFRCGDDSDLFGNDLARLEGPGYAEGWLPLVGASYRVGAALYAQEVFAAVDPPLAERGAVFVKFALREGEQGSVSAQVDGDVDPAPAAGEGWRWAPGRRRLLATLRPGRPAFLAIFTEPPGAAPLAPEAYAEQRLLCVERWRALLAGGTSISVPERVVNDAWRSMLVGSYMLLNGDRLFYSAGNQYQGMYIAEGGDAIRSMLLYGHGAEARRMVPPLLDHRRPGLEYHQAALKLQLLAHFYWLTRDAEFLRSLRDRWGPEVQRLVQGRDPSTGLLPRERYCGDIATKVTSLNSHANGWRALRDISAVLEEAGEGGGVASEASAWRTAVLAAVEKSTRRDIVPPFVPIALLGDEQPYERTAATRMGGYYNLMAPYVLGSGLFGPGSAGEREMLDYLHQRGSVGMGMIRCRPQVDLFTVKEAVNHLYGIRYDLANLRRDDVDRALVSFYGTLAQGVTKDTFISGEAAGLAPLDAFGRPFYLPPNSAGNAHVLWLLRYLLVQDWDLDDDGRPETLRLLFATPRAWLEEGRAIAIERAPTAFGDVWLHAESRLAAGEVVVSLDVPPRRPERLLLRARVPEGWKATAARVGDERLVVDGRGTVDLSGRSGSLRVRFLVAR